MPSPAAISKAQARRISTCRVMMRTSTTTKFSAMKRTRSTSTVASTTSRNVQLRPREFGV